MKNKERNYFERKIRKIHQSFQITIPKDIMLKYKWDAGTNLIIKPNGKGMLIYDNKLPSFLQSSNRVYTMGYEGQTIDSFIKTLKDLHITQVIDIREVAYSRNNGFSKSTISKKLKENGIKYHHFPQLGAPKK